MLGDIWTKTLWDQRRALAGWGIGLMVVSLIYGAFYPFAGTPEYGELIESLPAGLAEAMGWDEIASPHGYLGSTVFGILGPVLAIIFAIGTGARAIAGDEENGTLELLVAHPVTRRRIVTQRVAALGVALAMAGLVVFLAILTIRGPIDLTIPVGHIAAASLNLALLAAVFGTLALFVGAIAGRRGLVIGVTAVVAVVAYLANGLAPQVDSLAWLQKGSPFHWFAGTDTLRDGLDPASSLLLLALAALFTLAAVFAFDRRDIAT